MPPTPKFFTRKVQSARSLAPSKRPKFQKDRYKPWICVTETKELRGRERERGREGEREGTGRRLGRSVFQDTMITWSWGSRKGGVEIARGMEERGGLTEVGEEVGSEKRGLLSWYITAFGLWSVDNRCVVCSLCCVCVSPHLPPLSL